MINITLSVDEMKSKLKNKKNRKNIVLTGMMGSGKSSIAKALNMTLKEFILIDTDAQIEKEQDKSISNIFKLYGEEYFRDLENQVILKFSNTYNNIIATGGGSMENIVNLKNLQRNGIVFYLCASPNELFERVKNDTNRPILTKKNQQKEFEELLKKREQNYNLADYKIITTEKNINEIANEIIQKYLEYEEKYSQD